MAAQWTSKQGELVSVLSLWVFKVFKVFFGVCLLTINVKTTMTIKLYIISQNNNKKVNVPLCM